MMNNHETQPSAQDTDSVDRSTPTVVQSAPTHVPGYELQYFLGAGAYGQVWVAVDETTKRKVAIKFFTHPSAVNWPLLSREVEKLVFLSADRYVVQLLDVGWNSDPPYYVMEFIETGSLADYLRQHGTLPTAEAVQLFREIAIGLSHAHRKGILHCDLKPANILVDNDRKPRLADFGQSRLTHEQSPALGTLFFMAPEQAHLDAVPDARWDVYALGAILHCMLTGAPPYRDADTVKEVERHKNLQERLAAYRKLIEDADDKLAVRKLPGVDRALLEILEGCLAKDAHERFPHVANVLDALDRRQRMLSRRPLLLLGLVGPLLLLITMSLFGYRAYKRSVEEATELVQIGTNTSNRFAVDGEAQIVALEIERRFRTIVEVARRTELIEKLHALQTDAEGAAVLKALCNGTSDDTRQQFVSHNERQQLQDYLDALVQNPRLPRVASWILTDARGVMTAAAFQETAETSPVGGCYAYRSYFHGGPHDLAEGSHPAPLTDTRISDVFRSTATGTIKVAMTTPVLREGSTIGVIGVTVEMGNFVRFPTSEDHCALLVDARPGKNQGVILEHPLFERFVRQREEIPAEFFETARIPASVLDGESKESFADPFATHAAAADYRGEWLASASPVKVNHLSRVDGREKALDTGLLMVVQARAERAIAPVDRLARRLFREGVAAVATVVGLIVLLWYLVVRMLRAPTAASTPINGETMDDGSVHSRETLPALPEN